MTVHRCFLLAIAVVLPSVLLAQLDEPLHTELDWQTIETEHFLVHFHNGESRTAAEVAHIAEAVYTPITSMYQHVPDQKVSFVLRDHDDYSNGASYFYDNKIELWAPAMDFDLRGIHPWLWNVVTHEFTHMIQIQTTMKLGRRIPALYFQWFGYEAERRPDVLYGFPNVLVSYPLSAFVVPSWFAEGTAQFNHPDLHFDYWDTHRDMILRMYMIDGNPLGWEEMAVFGKTSLGNESSYNAGFSIVQYIADRYGADKLRAISVALSSLPRLTIDGAIEKALGISGRTLYDNWKQDKTEHYRKVEERIRKDLVAGEVIAPEGFGNFFPAFSPDGKSVVYISNKGHDYFGQSSVFLYDVAAGTTRKVVDGVRSTVSFSPDGHTIYYSRISSDNPHWSRLSDLYRYNLRDEEETRLTHGLRALNPRISPDGKTLVFTYGSDGTMNIGVCDSTGSNVRKVTQFSNGEQVYTPVWSPDGQTIAAGYSTGTNESVVLVHPDGTGFTVVANDGDCRNPSFSGDGRLLYYSSDHTGIFNIFSRDMGTGETLQQTNVLGGAFVPSVNSGGDIAFASYTSSGYKIALLRSSADRPRQSAPIASLTFPASGDESIQTVDVPSDTVTSVTSSPARPYKNVFTSLSFIPMIRVDNYNPKNKGIDIVKPGLYFTSTDMLDKLSLFGGAAINRKLERDLFFMFEYRDRLPWLYKIGIEPALSLELYNITRKTTSTFTLDPSPVLIKPEITYNLFEVDLSARQWIFNEKTELHLWYTLSRYSADIGSFVNPNDNSLYAAFRSTYLIGNAYNVELRHKNIEPGTESEINPVGRSILLRYAYESNEFNAEGEFAVEDGVLVPQYKDIRFHRLEVQWDEHMKMPFEHHTLSLGVRAAGIFGRPVDEFFDFYAGGVIGMKGYPFYALGGNKVATTRLTYRFPISRSLDFRFLQFYFTKLYGSFFGDVGAAWTGTTPPVDQWRKDAGFELRLESFSFYAYPTRFFFSGAYGFDRFSRTFAGVNVSYGREWRFYLGVLFGFELNDLKPPRIF